VRSGSTGATTLNLGIVTVGGGTTQAIDLIRRPIEGEDAGITAERYYTQASLRILLSDDPADITNLPCISSGAPFDLSQLAMPVSSWSSSGAVGSLKTAMTSAGTTALPLAASGAKTTTTNSSSYNSTDGYWLPYGYPIIKGYIKIDAQTTYGTGTACGTWTDVTREILALGYVGGNLNPQASLTSAQHTAPTSSAGEPLLSLPTTGQLGANPCAAPHPNAVIRFERVRDNPSTWTSSNHCGSVSTSSPPADFWPNVLFDTREGTLRDNTPSSTYVSLPTLNGTMHYIELDAANLAKWFKGTLGSTGPSTKDASVAPNDFVVYISDRRGNYAPTGAFTGNWPPLSPDGHETGEYGWTDFVNAGNPTTGCPNNSLNTGEDLDSTGLLYTYGANDSYIRAQGTASSSLTYGQYGVYNNLTSGTTPALKNDTSTCSVPSYASTIWPMTYSNNNNAARENPPLFFRRAVKIVNGSNLSNLGTCPGGIACGLTIVAENPVYIQGDYNAPSSGFNNPHVAASVAGDSVTLLSNNWNDANSFSYNLYVSAAPRSGSATYYRTAVIAGKGLSFPQPSGTGQDYGTDGGMHNFLRFVENWGGAALNYRGSIISMYYNRQATGTYKCCTTVYSPPTRGYNFDTEFLQPNLLPPRTPLFRDVNTTGFTQLLLPTQ
jgi:hypothetical protein